MTSTPVTSTPVISLSNISVYEYDEQFERAKAITAEFERLFRESYIRGFYSTDVKNRAFIDTVRDKDWSTYYNTVFSEVAQCYEVKHRCGNVDLTVRYEKPLHNVLRYEFHSWFGFGVNATKTGMTYDANKVIKVFPKFVVVPITDIWQNILAELRRTNTEEVEKNRNILRLFVCGGYVNSHTSISQFATYLGLNESDVEDLLHA